MTHIKMEQIKTYLKVWFSSWYFLNWWFSSFSDSIAASRRLSCSISRFISDILAMFSSLRLFDSVDALFKILVQFFASNGSMQNMPSAPLRILKRQTNRSTGTGSGDEILLSALSSMRWSLIFSMSNWLKGEKKERSWGESWKYFSCLNVFDR